MAYRYTLKSLNLQFHFLDVVAVSSDDALNEATRIFPSSTFQLYSVSSDLSLGTCSMAYTPSAKDELFLI